MTQLEGLASLVHSDFSSIPLRSVYRASAGLRLSGKEVWPSLGLHLRKAPCKNLLSFIPHSLSHFLETYKSILWFESATSFSNCKGMCVYCVVLPRPPAFEYWRGTMLLIFHSEEHFYILKVMHTFSRILKYFRTI